LDRSLTGWGVIKGHYYTGGVFALQFAPDDSSLYLAGMGTTRDPAAGNGKQLWEQWAWQDGTVEKLAAARDGEIGQVNAKMRASKALWSADGTQLFVAGGGSQGKTVKELDEGKPWGRVKVFKLA
jgi:hypothetical protein